jgi:hypothetical protein
MKSRPARSKTITLSLSFFKETYACRVRFPLSKTTLAYLRRAEPFVFVFKVIHCHVEFQEVLVSEKWIVGEVELPPGVGEAGTVAFARKVHPP